ncbi:MAG: hypothetical protein H7125_16230, partial [Proteobacteria bacterium]|nr:hypothetical protein [Burkholderiales bacterium]
TLGASVVVKSAPDGLVAGSPAQLAAYARRESALFGRLIGASGIEKE